MKSMDRRFFLDETRSAMSLAVSAGVSSQWTGQHFAYMYRGIHVIRMSSADGTAFRIGSSTFRRLATCSLVALLSSPDRWYFPSRRDLEGSVREPSSFKLKKDDWSRH